MFTQEWTTAQMFSTVLAHLQHTYFLEYLPVVDSASVVFSKRCSSDVIQLIIVRYNLSDFLYNLYVLWSPS